MRARVLLWLCLGLNVLLALMVFLLARDYTRDQSGANIYVQGTPGARQYKTNVVVRRQGFNWSEIESTDFPTYIANLRRIGCPDKTIRDIIVAEVTEVFADRLAREIVLPEQKWWESDPDMDAFEAGMNQVRALENEKTQLLTHLLGPDWNLARSSSSASLVRFDGPVLSGLSTEAKSNVERIEANSRRTRAELEEQARKEGRALSPADLARLREETRRELAAVLNPQQLEEYLLRYSSTSERMRDELRGFGANAEEFRRIFRARDSFDQQIASVTGVDNASVQRRAELARLREDAVKQAIGADRYSLYQASQDPLFREAQERAEQTGAAPEKVLPIYRINQAVQEEIARIQTDLTLSEDQRRIALVTVQQQQKNSIERILANEAAEPAAPTAAEQTARVPLPPLPLFVPPEAFDTPRNPKGPIYDRLP